MARSLPHLVPIHTWSWTGALNSQVSGSDRPANCRLRNHCVVRIYPQVASLSSADGYRKRRNIGVQKIWRFCLKSGRIKYWRILILRLSWSISMT